MSTSSAFHSFLLRSTMLIQNSYWIYNSIIRNVSGSVK